MPGGNLESVRIVAFRGERGSYNAALVGKDWLAIVAFRGERGSYNQRDLHVSGSRDCSLPG